MPNPTEIPSKRPTLNIGMGTKLQVQFGISGDELKLMGALVGLMQSSCLMIGMPPFAGILSRLIEGSAVTVRYVYAGIVYGFNSHILTHTLKPSLTLFISYPMSVEILNLRKEERLECFLPASIRISGKEFKGVILDINSEGCRVYIEYGADEPPSFDVGRVIRLSFQLTGVTEELSLDGEIRNFRKDDNFSEIGLRFDHKNKEAKAIVSAFVDSFSDLRFLPLIKAS